MQLASISSASSTPVLLNPAMVASSRPKSAASSAQTASAPSSTTAASATTTATAASAAPAHSSHAQAASAPSAAASSASTLETLVSGYSDTVNGTQYSGSVEESGGQYTASVPNLAGATATGASIEAAENSLDLRIDELV